MNLRWLLFDFVDPQLKLPPAHRKRVRLRTMIANRHRERWDIPKWLFVMTSLVPGIGMLIGCVAAIYLLHRYRLPWYVALVIALGVQAIATWLLLAVVGRTAYRPLVCAELRQLGYDVCIKCGYWLRGLNENVHKCPECGAERQPMPEGAE